MTDHETLALAADYPAARAGFLAAADAAGAEVRSIDHPAAFGRNGETLAVDVASLGPANADHRVLVVSGTHGVEGYCGSAMQTNWLRHHRTSRPADVRLVMIHALNPYGFSWVRRVNEDNIDLNRNFVDFASGPPANAEYATIADDLVPTAWDKTTQAETTNRLLGRIDELGPERMQAVVSSGQYDHPTGLFYGGPAPSWTRRTLEGVWAEEMAAATTACVLDIHTGLGSWGHGELISHERSGSPGYQRSTARWGEVRSMLDGESVSAALSGDWLGAIARWAGDTAVDALAIEYGTVDSVTVLQSLRADAWLHGHGDPTGDGAAAIRRQVWTAFLDDDPGWIATCNEQFVDRLLAALRTI
ncbi:MAG: DUF2817 domain-containing protein [Actinomycetota bacterium]